MKLKHVRESDFKEMEFDYPDFQVELAKKLQDVAESPMAFLTDSSGKKLIILAVDESIDRRDREIYGAGKYRITVEPMGPPGF